VKRVPCPHRVPTVSQDTAKAPKSDRVPVSLSIRHGHGTRVIDEKTNHIARASVSPNEMGGSSR
jgi:hypothetical protein